MTLEQQRVVIIGGTAGMGRATAQAIAAIGAQVVIASRSAEKLATVQAELGPQAEAWQLDFTQEPAVQHFFNQIGPFDHLVITAAVGVGGPFLKLDTAAARAFFDSKFWGQYLSCRYGAPNLRPGGSITLFGGVASQKPIHGYSAIAAVNGALEGLCRSLALELAPLRVNLIAPGLVDTSSGPADPQRETFYHNAGSRLPVKRIGQPADAAQAVLYLIQNGFTTGTILYMDGGARIV